MATDYVMEEFENTDMTEADEINTGQKLSSYINVNPTRFPGLDTANGQRASISMKFDSSISSGVKIMRANAESRWEYVELDTTVEDDTATAETSSGGVFVVTGAVATGLIAGVVIAAFVLLMVGIAIGGLVVYFIVRRDKWQKTKDNTRKMKQKITRSFAKQV